MLQRKSAWATTKGCRRHKKEYFLCTYYDFAGAMTGFVGTLCTSAKKSPTSNFPCTPPATAALRVWGRSFVRAGARLSSRCPYSISETRQNTQALGAGEDEGIAHVCGGVLLPAGTEKKPGGRFLDSCCGSPMVQYLLASFSVQGLTTPQSLGPMQSSRSLMLGYLYYRVRYRGGWEERV